MLEQPLDQQLLGCAQVPTGQEAGTHTPSPPGTHSRVCLQGKMHELGTGVKRQVCGSMQAQTDVAAPLHSPAGGLTCNL